MIGPVSLGGKWWAHNEDHACSEVQIGPHIHYGQNVILDLKSDMIPEDVVDEYYVLFGNPAAQRPRGVINASDVVMETTDAPPYETTSRIPRKRTDQQYDDGQIRSAALGTDAPG